METQDDHAPLEPRLANTDDLVSLCRFLNGKTKQTHREKDALDRTFLAELLKKKGTKP